MSKKPSPKNIIRSLYSKSQLGLSSGVYFQLFHAALGTISPEVNSDRKLPIEQGFSSHQYNRLAVIERTKKLLQQSDLQASITASEVISELEHYGVGVNQVQLLLDPSFSKQDKKKAFDALSKNLELNELGAKQCPTTATVAIATNIISAPDTTWSGRFSTIAAHIHRGQSSLVESINTTESYLWIFPPADNRETCMASHDIYSQSQVRASAEMGMGFSIIQAPFIRDVHYGRRRDQSETYQQYNLYTPLWYLPRHDAEWTLGNIIRSDIRDGAPWSDYRLKDLLPKGLESLPRIHACRKCQMLFIDETPSYKDIPVSCGCGSTELV